MALVINDRVKETTTTTGTGAVALAGAVTGFETFAAGVGNSNTTYYSVHAQAIVDITNVSTHKVKFFHNTESTVTADGSTSENKVYATFLRLGNT